MERLMSTLDAYKRQDKYAKYGNYDPEFVVKLVNNYRSDRAIMAIPSELFYDGELYYLAKTDTALLQAIGYTEPMCSSASNTVC